MMKTMIDTLDQHQPHHHPDESDVVVVDIIVGIHHHLVHVLLVQVHRLIVLVHHQVVHIEDIDIDEHVCFKSFSFSHNEIYF